MVSVVKAKICPLVSITEAQYEPKGQDYLVNSFQYSVREGTQ